MNVPDNLLYTKEHEWVRVTNDTAVVGITDFAQGELGDVVYIEVTLIEERVASGDSFGSIEAVKTVSDLFAPITGVINVFNEELESQPEEVNKDPYGNGWIIEMSIENPAELDTLLTPEQYREYISGLK